MSDEHPELDTLPEIEPPPLDGRLGSSMPPGLREMKRAVAYLSLGSLVSITSPYFLCFASMMGGQTELAAWSWLSWALLLPVTAIAGGVALARAIRMKRDYGVFPEVAWLAVFTLCGVPGGVVFLALAIQNVR
jgi:hypothetical protein